MPEERISRERVDALGRKLDELGSALTEDERELLLTVFGQAAVAMGTAEKEAEVSGYSLTPLGTAPLSMGLQAVFYPSDPCRFVAADHVQHGDFVVVKLMDKSTPTL